MHCTKRSGEFKVMSIQHQHFSSLSSTQSFLRGNWHDLQSSGDHILISTDNQTKGMGRQGAAWKHLNHSLAMSFVISGHRPFLGLTSLEMACLVAKFFKNSPLQLKWPNDIFIEGKKCGGLILQNLSEEFLACGLGLNINQPANLLKCLDHDREAGALTLKNESSLRELAFEIYSFILNNRMSSKEIRQEFLERCLHLGKTCEIKQGKDVLTKGIFTGIGDQGEALIKDSSGFIRKNFSGSLVWKTS